ncbi:MAG: molybdopterin molybdotransferase MoeA [Rubricoccaceae bacterium]
MISVADADRLLHAHADPLGAERVPLARAAGRVLRERATAERDLPPFDRVAMDGVALASAAVRAGAVRFRVASVQAAGEPPHTLPDSGACVEVMTGAALPLGADAVVPYEALRLEAGTATLTDAAAVRPHQNVHARGADGAAGSLVLGAGVRIGPAHVAALASAGCAAVRVAARPRLAILATGDELVPPGAPVLPHQIRASNGPALAAALALAGYDAPPPALVRDDPDALRAAIRTGLETDVLLLSGGVSAGRYDRVPELLAEAGVRVVFHKVRQKPGKPLWFGVTGDGRAAFGLLGNPVSALVCLVRYVLPFLARREGADALPSCAVRLTALPPRKNDFTHFVAVRREGLEAHPVPTNGSGDVLSLLPSDGLAEVPFSQSAPGPVLFRPWPGR